MADDIVEKRRLQELGGSLFISVPQVWVKKFGLKKGSEIILQSGTTGELCLTPHHQLKSEKNTKVLSFGPFLYREILAEYLVGTEFIVIQNSQGFSKAERDEVTGYVDRLMNVEVVDETSTKITIQHFRTQEVSLKMLLQRMYFLTHNMLTDLAAAKSKAECESIFERDRLVGRLYLNIIMHQRSLLTKGLLTKEFSLIEILDMRLFIKQIEQIGDEIKALAHDFIEGKKCKLSDLRFLSEKYAQAVKAYFEKDVVLAREFWTTEKQDKQRLRYNPALIRIYLFIKDISDLVI